LALQMSDPVRNARLDIIETTMGLSPVLTVRVGAPPANCAAANTAGAVLATINLPSDWMNAASGGTKTMAGSWQDSSADAGGTAGHFRIHQGATCHLQGVITTTGGGGDMTVDSTTLTAGQYFTVTAFTLTEANG